MRNVFSEELPILRSGRRFAAVLESMQRYTGMQGSSGGVVGMLEVSESGRLFG